MGGLVMVEVQPKNPIIALKAKRKLGIPTPKRVMKAKGNSGLDCCTPESPENPQPALKADAIVHSANRQDGCSTPEFLLKANGQNGSGQDLLSTITKITKSYKDKQHFRIATQQRIQQYKLNCGQQFLKELKNQEYQAHKLLKQTVPQTQIGAKLCKIKGMGPRFASQLITFIHPINRWKGVRSLWHYAGWIPKTERGHNYNHRLHALTVSIIKKQIKVNGPYGKLYNEWIEKLKPKISDNEVKLQKTAFQRTAKQFLKDLFLNWRNIQNG